MHQNIIQRDEKANMFTKQKDAKQGQSLADSIDLLALNSMCSQSVKSSLGLDTRFSLNHLLVKISVSCTGMLFLVLTSVAPAFAENSTGAPRWYRYYNSQGIPTLSSTISEQHLQYGYDSLDKNMHLISHFSPFSGQKYAQQQAQREQAIERRISERHLQETYISSSRAESQRDRELSDLDGQIKRSQVQSVTLSSSLNQSITLAANFERQNKPIPETLKNQLRVDKDLLNQSKTNFVALKVKREQTSKKYNDAIATLKVIEQRENKPNTSNIP